MATGLVRAARSAGRCGWSTCGTAQAMRPDLFVAVAAYGDYAPGYIGTEMVRAIAQDVLDKRIIPQIPVGRLGEPEEIARCVLFLAADDAGSITGSTLSANGGQYMA